MCTEHVLCVYKTTGTDLSVFLPPVDLKEMLLEGFPMKIVASQDTKELVRARPNKYGHVHQSVLSTSFMNMSTPCMYINMCI